MMTGIVKSIFRLVDPTHPPVIGSCYNGQSVCLTAIANCDGCGTPGKKWSGYLVLSHCDNAAVVAILRSEWCNVSPVKSIPLVASCRILIVWNTFQALLMGPYVCHQLTVPHDLVELLLIYWPDRTCGKVLYRGKSRINS